MKKFLCLLLALLMVAIPLVACADPGDAGKETGGADKNPADSGNEEKDELELPDKSYKGKSVQLLYEQKQDWGFFPQDFDEDNADDAYVHGIYLRNDAVEQKLGIEIEGTELGGSDAVQESFRLGETSGSSDYDIVFNTVQKLCADVANKNVLSYDNLPWVKLDKVWWNQDARNQLSLGGVSYLNAGDIMISDKDVMWAVYFLKDRLKQYPKLPNPYELVYNNEWTWDNMMMMADTAHQDANSDDQMTINSSDIFGLCTHPENYPASWEAAGLKLVEIDQYGTPSLAWGSDQFYDVYTDIVEIMENKMVVSPTDIGWISTALSKDKTLFGTEVISFVRKYRDSDYPFGILPYPKYNSSISRFNSYVAVNSDVVAVGYSHPDTEFVSVVLETMAYYGREKLIPVYYDEQLKGRYSDEEDDSKMLDIIFEYRCYDLGVYFDSGYSILNKAGANPSTAWGKSGKNLEKSLNKKFEKLLNG